MLSPNKATTNSIITQKVYLGYLLHKTGHYDVGYTRKGHYDVCYTRKGHHDVCYTKRAMGTVTQQTRVYAYQRVNIVLTLLSWKKYWEYLKIKISTKYTTPCMIY